MTKKILKIEDLHGGTYNQAIRKITELEGGVKKLIVRKESDFLNKPLVKEIEFLLSLNKKAKLHFPEIRSYRTDRLSVFYEMPYYHMENMGGSILEGKISSEYCIGVIENILNFMFKCVFSQNIKLATNNDLIKHTFFRVRDRYKQLHNKSTIVEKFLGARRIIIEGKPYKNVPEILSYLIKDTDLIKKLTLKTTHMVHGDFHFSNFLVDLKDPNKFILLDPRGEKKGYDYAYDLGKLWHSFHGLYDLMHEGIFELDYCLSGDIIEVGVFKPEKCKALETYNEIYDKRQKFVDICSERMECDNVELQILFNEAIHFCALAPFHLKNDGVEKASICRYLMGVKLLNDFIDKL